MALKLGTENKTKTYAAIGLGIITLLLAVHFIYDNFFSNPTPAPAAIAVPAQAPTGQPVPASSGGTTATPFAHQAMAMPSASALDPTLHPEWMAQAEDTTYTGTGRNIFSASSAPVEQAHIEKPRGPIRPQAVVAQGPPPPPNIDLKFYGYTADKAGVRRACLLHGEDIFLAFEGDVVDRRYKVVKINPFSIEVEDLPYSHTQTLPLLQN